MYEPENCGDVVEAYLAAADASEKLTEHVNFPTVPWHREYGDLVGGTFNDTDETARFINDWVKNYYKKQPPVRRSRSLRPHTE